PLARDDTFSTEQIRPALGGVTAGLGGTGPLSIVKRLTTGPTPMFTVDQIGISTPNPTRTKPAKTMVMSGSGVGLIDVFQLIKLLEVGAMPSTDRKSVV